MTKMRWTPAWRRSWCGAAASLLTGLSHLDALRPSLQERLDSGMSNEGRSDALTELKLLLSRDPQAQRAVGQIGLHLLLSIARDERDDVELVRGALEALLQALTPVPAEHGAAAGVSPAAVNAELLGRELRHVALLLELLDDADLYVRYHSLQVLSALLPSHAAAVQQVVLASPVGVARLVDLVSDQEVVRNEALLLLNAMARDKEDIQKLLAFEGAFERLLAIVRDEGGPEGGVVVQDCIELVNTLLRSCAPNQRLFREVGLLAQLPSLLSATGRGADAALSRQAAANVLCAMETACMLLSPCGDEGDATVRVHQAALCKVDMLSSLLPLALGTRAVFSAVSTAALLCASKLVAGHPPAQEALGNATVACEGSSAGTEPALLGTLRAALHGANEQIRSAAVQLVAAYCEGNSEGQQLLVSTLIPMGSMDIGPADHSFGRQLSAALADDSHDLACRAARLLQPLVVGNAAAKERLLRVPLDSASAAVPELVLTRCAKLLAKSARAGAGERGDLLLELLRLLCIWLHDCPPAVAALLSSPGHLPLLIDLASSNDVHVAGTSAAVLAACVASNPTVGDCDAQTVLDAIAFRISLPQYFQTWEIMLASPEFGRAASADGMRRALVTRECAAAAVDGGVLFPGGVAAGGGVSYSWFLASALRGIESAARKRLLAMYARPASHGAASAAAQGGDMPRLQAALHVKEAELADLQAHCVDLEQQLAELRGGASQGGGVDVNAAIASARQEAERELAAARAETAEARAMVVRHEDSLRSLSQAYNALEAAHTRLEKELQQARGQGPSPADEQELQAAADAEHEQEMSDLLVCLGQEESKVERLCQALRGLGQSQDDIDAVLEAAGSDE